MNHRHSFLIAVIGLVFGAFDGATCNALEEVVMWNGAYGAANVEQQKKSASTKLMLQIDDLDRICKLSEKQKKKLEVAIKGVLQKRFPKRPANDGHGHDHDHDHDHVHIEVFNGAFVPQRVRFNDAAVQEAIQFIEVAPPADAVPPDTPPEDVPVPVEGNGQDEDAGAQEAVPNEPLAEERVEVPAAADEGPQIEVQALVDLPAAPPDVVVERFAVNVDQNDGGDWVAFGQQLPVGHNNTPILAEPLWQQTVARVLTPQQAEAYRKEQQRRQQAHSQAVLNLGIAQAAKELMLSAEQAEKLRRLCQAFIKRDANLAHNLGSVHSMVHHIDLNLARAFLSKAQVAAWNSLKGGYGVSVYSFPQPALNQVDVPPEIAR